jgi:DNA-3-methyladenine glycosylase
MSARSAPVSKAPREHRVRRPLKGEAREETTSAAAHAASPGLILGPQFFDRRTLSVARELIGKFLVRRQDGEDIGLMISETEAYDGPLDKASHAHRGRTPRNSPMFGAAGTIYVYFTYGMHFMLNLVCGQAGHPAAVLIRGAGDIAGPARLTKALGIDKSLNDKPLGVTTGLWVEDRGVTVRPRDIQRTPRIGIGYAEDYVGKPWRFVMARP